MEPNKTTIEIVNSPDKDKEAPRADSTEITVSDVKSDGFTISWKKATDNVTDAKLIKYVVYYSIKDDDDDPWHPSYPQRDIDTYTFKNLKDSTKYIFFVEAIDEAGNILTYPKDNSAMMQETLERQIYRPTSSNTVSRPTSSNTVSRPTASNTGSRAGGRPLTDEEMEEVLDEQRRKELAEFLQSMRQYERIDSINLTAGNPEADSYVLLSKNQVLELINREYTIGQEQKEFMPIDMSAIYPGRIVYADASLLKGKPVDVIADKTYGYGKVTVSVDFLGGKGESLTEHNVEASEECIKGAISRILQRALDSGALPPADVDGHCCSSNSKEKVSVDVGCSVDYLGANCKVDISTTRNQETFYQVEKFRQGFFTINVKPEGDDPVNYFGKKITASLLSATTKVRRRTDHHPIAVISSVTYGRVGFNAKTYEAWSFNLKGDESGGYKKVFNALSKQDIEQSSATAYHYARVWGGSASAAGSAIAAGIGTECGGKDEDMKIDAAFTNEMAKRMEFSFSNQGVPISYKVRFLVSGKEIAAFLTGKYVESQYVPLVNRLHLRLENDATTLLGTHCIKIYILYDYIQLDQNGRKIGEGFKQWTHEWKNKATVDTTIFLDDYCFIKDNEVKIVFYRRDSALSNYYHSGEGLMNVAGGSLKIKIQGSHSDKVYPGGSASKGYAQYK